MATTKTVRESFLGLQSPRDVASLLGVSYQVLTYYLYRLPEDCRYRRFDIAKASGGTRTILAPCKGIKGLQRQLNPILQEVYEVKPSVHGFVSRRNVVSNSQGHTRKRFVLNVDLKDFFPSINFGRVRGMFMARPYFLPNGAATTLARLCCFDNQLPQGAPTSPVVSNMLCAKLDSQLQKLAKKHGCWYTRYADDLSFSFRGPSYPNELATNSGGKLEIGRELQDLISENGFVINIEKLRLRHLGQRQEVTGLTLNKFPNVERRFVRQVRAMLHAWRKFGEERAQEEFGEKYDRRRRGAGAAFREVVRGKIAYIGLVKGKTDPVHFKLNEQFMELLDDQYVPRPVPTEREFIRQALWVLECMEEGENVVVKQGTAVAIQGIGLVTCAHVLCDRSETFRAEDPSSKYEVEVRWRDDERDLAVLNIVAPLTRTLIPDADVSVRDGMPVTVAGFPNYRYGDTASLHMGRVAAFRVVRNVRRFLVDAAIVAGTSPTFSPVFDFGAVDQFRMDLGRGDMALGSGSEQRLGQDHQIRG